MLIYTSCKLALIVTTDGLHGFAKVEPLSLEELLKQLRVAKSESYVRKSHVK